MKNLVKYFKKIWNHQKGKAMIKLSLWVLFFGMAIITFTFSKPSTQSVQNKKITKEFIDFKIMWKNLEESNYSYEYIVTNKITKDILTYNGKVENEVNTGYRESKLGIIKYKQIGSVIYQIVGTEEEIIENLYEGINENYLNLSQLKSYFNILSMSEEQKENTKIMKYENETEIITIKMNLERIRSIQIETEEQYYELSFYEEK